MSLRDYEPTNGLPDLFEYAEGVKEYGFAFPCCVCRHAESSVHENPCCGCGHNTLAEHPTAETES